MDQVGKYSGPRLRIDNSGESVNWGAPINKVWISCSQRKYYTFNIIIDIFK